MLEGWLAAPLIGRSGQRLGLIQVADKADGEFTETDESVLFQLAQLASVAIENAERFELEHSVADVLQRALLPRSLPEVKGVEVAARYQAGGAGTDVGGDWYDVVAMGDGRVVLTLGDVMGRGPRAAAIMGQLRTALHAYALHDLPPSVAMRSADLLLQDVAEGDIATAVYMVLDPIIGRVEVVTAGHPAPVVVEPSGRRGLLACDPHTPFGVLPAPVYNGTADVLLAGTVVLLYTDGLVERREASLDERTTELLASIDPNEEDLGIMCDRILERMVPDAGDDDIALLAVRLVR
jgi:serine phosphatase RsbU (regulator of sigma subunit)